MSDQAGFTHGEVKLIFERAGELDALTVHERRYSLEEIQRMGAEAGLDRADIARAAATLRSTSASRGFLGAPSRFRTRRALPPGLGDDAINDVVSRVRAAIGRHGELRVVPGAIEWRARMGYGAVVIDFTPRTNETGVDILVACDDQAAGTVVGAGIASFALGVAAGALLGHGSHSVLVGLGTGLIVGAGSLLTSARAIWSRLSRRWAVRTEELGEMVSEGFVKPPS